jgi:hypothetical protein
VEARASGVVVGGEFGARGGKDVWNEVVVAVVAEGVGGDVADGGFGEVGRKRRAGWEEMEEVVSGV